MVTTTTQDEPCSLEPGSGIESVFVPLDGSDHGVRALHVAAAIAAHVGCSVTIAAFTPEDARRALEFELRRLVRKVLTSTPYSIIVRQRGSSIVADIGREIALQPNALLCMPTHGRGRSAGLLGSVATDVVCELDRAVLLVGPACDGTQFDPTRTVVVASKTVEPSEQSRCVASAWSSAFGAPVAVITVIEDEATRGNVAQRIVDKISPLDVSVLVVESSGRRGAERMAVGSIAADVTRHGGCPVLVHKN